jgi:hypothetical protein
MRSQKETTAEPGRLRGGLLDSRWKSFKSDFLELRTEGILLCSYDLLQSTPQFLRLHERPLTDCRRDSHLIFNHNRQIL